MKKIYYNKLVRDSIKDIIEAKGEQCAVRTITDSHELQQELLKKVIEEAGALAHARTREEFLSEYADLMVVLDTLTNHLEFSEADIETALEENVERKGLYENKHFLHWSEDEDYACAETPQGIK